MRQVKPKVKSENALVALGSNAPLNGQTTRDAVTWAVAKLAEIFDDVAISPLYQTPAFPAGSGPDFVNAAACFQTQRSAADVLSELHQIEQEAGRTRTVRWGQRSLDIDLIALGAQVLPDTQVQTRWRRLPLEAQKTDVPDQLILPHPRVQDRSFVLVPLADVAPDWVHPLLGRTVVQMRDDRPTEERADVQPI